MHLLFFVHRAQLLSGFPASLRTRTHVEYSHTAGFAMLFLMLPLQTLTGKLFAKLRGRATLLTDERVKKMNEVISGMRVMKMYAWEDAFQTLVGMSFRKGI